MGGKTLGTVPRSRTTAFQSTCPMGGKTQLLQCLFQLLRISIHLPHGGQDGFDFTGLVQAPISIHLPHGGQDDAVNKTEQALKEFQSTCPMGGKTVQSLHPHPGAENFNPLAPWGARHPPPMFFCSAIPISIHLPHGGQDATLRWRG